MASITITLTEDRHRYLAEAAAREGRTVEEFAARNIADGAKPINVAEDIDARSMYPHLAKVFGSAGWDDPQMDDYNPLDPRASK